MPHLGTCHHKGKCRCKCCWPCPPCFVCGNRVQLRLAGLTENPGFQFFKLKGCVAIIEFEDSDYKMDIVTGVLCNLGTDFVEVRKENNKVVTILAEKIKGIARKDPKCHPCLPWPYPLDFYKPC